MTRKKIPTQLLIYQATNWAIQLKANADQETIWANQAQISAIFGVDRTVITKHINNIFKDDELDKKVVSAKFAHTTQHGALKGKTQTKEIAYYNLDIILAVWYRVKSSIAIKFRQRATKTLKQHITQGFTINKKQLAKNYNHFLQVVEDIKKLTTSKPISPGDVLELIKVFGQTWFSLNAFDKNTTQAKKQTQKTVKLEATKLYNDILKLKENLMTKQEASDFFAQEKQAWAFEGIFGNIFQSAFGKDAYPSIESKAAHLLYFTIKNHPFVDGNKRSGAFSFIRFLQKVGYNFQQKITPEALAAIALLIATSDSKDKKRIIDVVILLLSWK